MQTSPSLQLGGGPPAQAPLLQASLVVQALLSLHAMPLFVWMQPDAGLHPSVVQTFPSLQLGATPGLHVPFWHVSTPLHALPSEHDVPFTNATLSQPEAESQLSAVHGLPSLQLRAAPGMHAPFWQVSTPLHALLSEHDEPFATAGCWQPLAGRHESAVHAFPSSQLGGTPARQVPPAHCSLPSQAFPLSH